MHEWFRIAMACVTCRVPGSIFSVDVSERAAIRLRFICPMCGKKMENVTTLTEIMSFQQAETASAPMVQ